MPDKRATASQWRTTRGERDGRTAEDEPSPEDRAEDEPADDDGADDERAGQAEDEDAPAGDRPRTRTSAGDAASAGLTGLAELTGKKPEGVTSVQPTEDGWRVAVEFVEDERVPSSADILAIYEADLDPDGTLLSYRRTRRYARGRGDGGSSGER